MSGLTRPKVKSCYKEKFLPLTYQAVYLDTSALTEPLNDKFDRTDKNYLLASIRDVNTLKMIDIRMNQVVETYW